MSNLPSLSRSLVDYGPEIYYQANFRDVIEMHIPMLNADKKTVDQPIKPNIAYKNENDFFGLLRDLSIPVYLHWVIMRMNGMYNPNEYSADMLTIKIPSTSLLETLREKHVVIHQIR